MTFEGKSVRRTRTLIAASAAIVATVGGITVASATAEPATKTEAVVSAPAPESGDVSTAETADVVTEKETAKKADAAAVKTKIVWTKRNTWVTYGKKAVLEGQVQVSQGALPGVEVVLFARNSTAKPWTRIDSMKTSTKTGLFRFYRTPPRNYYFGVAFAGSGNYEPAAGYAKVGVRRKLSPSKMSRISSTKFKYFGSVKPGGKGTQIKLQYKRCASCGYKYAKYTRANANGTWKFELAAPPRGNTYYYRAYSPSSSSYMAGYASEWRISSW